MTREEHEDIKALTVKQMKSFRLTKGTVKELEELAARHAISQADVVTILIHLQWLSGNTDKFDDWAEMARKL
jgi:hypothetical protein